MLKLQNGQRRGWGELLIREVDPEVDPLAAGNDRPSLGHCQAITGCCGRPTGDTKFHSVAANLTSNQHDMNDITYF